MAPDGTLAKSSQLNKPVWWPSESRAQQAYDAGYGAEGAKPVALALVLDDYGYNGYGPDPQDLQFARESRGLMGEGTDYDPMGDEGVPHVGVRPEYALAFIDASYGDRRMELVVDKLDAELARVVMKKLRKQGQTSGVQPTRQRFHPSEVTSREELLRLVSEPMSESIDYSFQNWWEYGFTDASNGDPPNPPDRPLEARDAYEDGYQEGLDLLMLMGRSAPMDESSWRDPINLSSIDILEATGREGMASYNDIEAAREILHELEDNMNTHAINLDDLKSARRFGHHGEVSASDIGLPTDLPHTFRISGVPQSTYTATSRMNVYGTPVVRYQNAFGETLRVMGY